MVSYRESFKFSWMFIEILRRTVKYESQIYLVNWKLINILIYIIYCLPIQSIKNWIYVYAMYRKIYFAHFS